MNVSDLLFAHGESLGEKELVIEGLSRWLEAAADATWVGDADDGESRKAESDFDAALEAGRGDRGRPRQHRARGRARSSLHGDRGEPADEAARAEHALKVEKEKREGEGEEGRETAAEAVREKGRRWRR